MFIGPARNHVFYVGDPPTPEFLPVVVGLDTGTCEYSSAPYSVPIVDGQCRAPYTVDPYVGEFNAVTRVDLHLLDGEGTIVSDAWADFAFVQPMADLDVPEQSGPTDSDIPVEASTSAGVPATYRITITPLVGVAQQGVDSLATDSLPPPVVLTGHFNPSMDSVGDSVSLSHSFDVPGTYRVSATLTDVKGTTRTGTSHLVVSGDNRAPTATQPTNSFVAGSALSSGKPTVRFRWSGSDSGSWIARYQLALSTDGGSYATLASSLTSASYSRALAAGHTYRARVRAIDGAGNVGAWAYGTSFHLSSYQESSSRIHWSSSWHSASSTAYWGGHERYATAAGAKASLTFTGRSVAWVGSLGPTRDWARVYINGTLVESINLRTASTSHRRVLFSKSWSTSATRTITIRVSGTSGHPCVDVDAFVVGT
jgi:hypothetical protein